MNHTNAAQTVKERRLSSAFAPKQAIDLSLFERKRHISQNDFTLTTLRQMFNDQIITTSSDSVHCHSFLSSFTI